MTRSIVSALALVLALPTLALSQLATLDEAAERCASRDTATAWRIIAADWKNERATGWTNDSLRNALIALAQADRAARPAPEFADSLRRPDVAIRVARRDSATLIAMRDIVRRFGWPTRSMVGTRGSAAALEIVANNPAVQEEALRLMDALPPDEVRKSEMAVLDDRFHMSRNEPQRYATQLRADSLGPAEFYPVDSVSRIGERRAAAGLPPMSVYLCIIRATTGRMPSFPPPEGVTATAVSFKPYWRLHAGAYFGAPQVASVALGGMYVLARTSDRSRWSGLLIIAEPGVRAGKLRFGFGTSNRSASGVSGTLAMVNYWGDGAWKAPSRIYGGYEIHVSGRHVDVGVGQYQSMQRAGKLRFAVSAGVGL